MLRAIAHARLGDGGGTTATAGVSVYGDKHRSRRPRRKIWNQHAHHITNVREDATIPAQEPPSWSALNTYRTNAQIEGGALCKPEPPG